MGALLSLARVSGQYQSFSPASMNPRSAIRIAVLTLLSASGINLLADPPSRAPETQDRSSVSPDKKWEYQPHEDEPKLVKAGTDQVAVSFADECNGGGCGHATVKVYRWADANTAMVYAVDAEEAKTGDLVFWGWFLFHPRVRPLWQLENRQNESDVGERNRTLRTLQMIWYLNRLQRVPPLDRSSI
jgi:hypothetical protein